MAVKVIDLERAGASAAQAAMARAELHTMCVASSTSPATSSSSRCGT